MSLYLIHIDSNTKTDAALISSSPLIPLHIYLRKSHLPYSFKILLSSKSSYPKYSRSPLNSISYIRAKQSTTIYSIQRKKCILSGLSHNCRSSWTLLMSASQLGSRLCISAQTSSTRKSVHLNPLGSHKSEDLAHMRWPACVDIMGDSEGRCISTAAPPA